MIKFREKTYSSLEDNMQVYHSFLDFEQRNGLLGDSPVMYLRNIGRGFSQLALLYSKKEDGTVEATAILLREKLYRFTCPVDQWPKTNEAIILGAVGYVGSLRKDLLADLNYRRGNANILQTELDFLAE